MTAPRETNEYVLGTQDAELHRLGFQHRLWSKQAAEAWEMAKFRPGHHLLDVGCGPGFAATELAQLVGESGRVLGVDVSERFIDYLKARAAAIGLLQVEAQVGDVQSMNLPAQSFDGAFVLQDYYYYRGLAICPTRPVVRKVVEAVDQSWRMRGGDPDVGKRLPTMLRQAGFDVARIEPIVRVARPDTALWRWPTTFFVNYLPVLIGAGLITKADAEEWNEHWEDRAADPASAFITPPMLSIIAVRRDD